jgi:hypothetical protein
MEPWCYGAMVPWCHHGGAMVPWYHDDQKPWCHGAKMPWCHGAMLHGAIVQCACAPVPGRRVWRNPALSALCTDRMGKDCTVKAALMESEGDWTHCNFPVQCSAVQCGCKLLVGSCVQALKGFIKLQDRAGQSLPSLLRYTPFWIRRRY